MRDRHYDTYERPPVLKWIPLSVQHVFAMFGATILVPILTGLSTTAALFTAGTGTLLYVLITGGKVPAFLGSSFAFIAPLIAISTSAQYGVAYAMGGAFCSGLFYCLVAAIIRTVGSGWLNRVLPHHMAQRGIGACQNRPSAAVENQSIVCAPAAMPSICRSVGGGPRSQLGSLRQDTK